MQNLPVMGFIYHGQSDVVSVLGTYRIIGGSVFPPPRRVTGNLAGAAFQSLRLSAWTFPLPPDF